MRSGAIAGASLVVLLGAVTLQGQQDRGQSTDQGSFRFKSGVELINVTATVTDGTGRFVPGLRQEDFVVYEDNELQQVTHFSGERVPVSLGIVLDTSGSMQGEKLQAAKSALNRFLYDLLDQQDEVFLYRFDDDPQLLQGWTTDRQALSRAVNRISADGATAMYDAVAEAVPLASSGRYQKKAIVLISDGNDTSSHTALPELKQLIRESEVLVYAIGIDGESRQQIQQQPPMPLPPVRLPIPLPFPGGGRRPRPLTQFPQIQWPPRQSTRGNERVNIVALRDLTDDSGGRTEIIRTPRDLDPATANIASELSQQYYLGYPSSGKRDGRWHAIRVEVRNHAYRVRARRGYIAS
jgi:Ca-activated chloride channel family protein